MLQTSSYLSFTIIDTKKVFSVKSIIEVSILDETQKLSISEMNREVVQIILNDVYLALEEKGYNPVTQMVGYIMSGDPSYITNHRNARSLIRKMERDELLEELVKIYAENRLNNED